MQVNGRVVTEKRQVTLQHWVANNLAFAVVSTAAPVCAVSIKTRNSATAEGPRDALFRLKSCQPLQNCTYLTATILHQWIGEWFRLFTLDYFTVLLPYTYKALVRKCVESAILRGWVTSRLNFRLKVTFRAEVYGPLDRGMIVLQLCCWKFSVKETLQQTSFNWSWVLFKINIPYGIIW